MPVFVERELTARRGRKRAQLRIRIHAPRPDSRGHSNWECAFEVTVDRKRLHTPSKLFGIDGVQALVLVLSWVVYTLEEYENDTGMTLDEWAWPDIWKLRMPAVLPGTKRRAAAIRRIHREYEAKYGSVTRSTSRTSATPRARAPRAKPARRKAPPRRRAAPRSS